LTGKYWYVLWPFGTFYTHLRYFMTIWYILCSIGTFFPVLVSCNKKNLATLTGRKIFAPFIYLQCHFRVLNSIYFVIVRIWGNWEIVLNINLYISSTYCILFYIRPLYRLEQNQAKSLESRNCPLFDYLNPYRLNVCYKWHQGQIRKSVRSLVIESAHL
jgi:hypothetical protein